MTDKIVPIEFLEGSLDTKLLNVSEIIEYVKKEMNMFISDSSMYLLNDELKELLQRASVRTIANNRRIIQGKDI